MNKAASQKPVGVGIKKSLASAYGESFSSNAPSSNPKVLNKKFSLVPFAKDKSNSLGSLSSHKDAVSAAALSNNKMELIQETPEDVKDGTGKNHDFSKTKNGNEKKEESENYSDYEDD